MQRVYAILALLSWMLLLWPFPIPVFLASCLACVGVPLYRRLLNHMKRYYANMLTALVLILVIALPIAIMISMVTPQALNGLKLLDGIKKAGWLQSPEMLTFLEPIDQWVRVIPGLEGGVPQLTSEAASYVGAIMRTMLSSTLGLAGSTLSLFMHIFVTILLTMMGILYATTFFHFAQITTHFPSAVLGRFITAIREAIRAVLAGVLLVAILQGVLCGIGFAAAGLPAPVFWSLIATCMAPIPIVGTSIVWLPAAIFVWFSVSKAAAVGLIIWCGLTIVGADNFLRPFLLRWGGIDAPVSVMLMAIIGGLIALGPIGILAGPVIAAFATQAGREAEQSKGDGDLSSPW